MNKDKLIDSKKISERFLKKIDSSETNTKCHTWLASKNKTGHGMFSVMGRTIPASRYSFMMFRGDVAPNEVVTQTCFNPSCVNPDHLEISDKRRLGKRISVNPAQLVTGSISFLVRLKKERPDLINKIEELITEINNPPTEVNFENMDPFSN
jgi:hypothetical protein|tara:strand:- start:65 stop:520 length:456 start_codon:yes stop_codon:yes gene_type:complete